MKLPFQKPAMPAGRRRVVGDSRAPVYSYHARRTNEQRVLPGRRTLRNVLTAENTSRAVHYSFRRIGAIAALVVGALSLVSMLTLSSDPKILQFDSGTAGMLQDPSVYESATRRLLAGSLANHTKLTVNTVKLSDELERQFPELSSVLIKLPLVGHRPIVYIQAAQPVLALSMANGQTVGIDTRGHALGVARPPLGLPVVKDESGAVVRPGQQALSATTVTFIQAVLFQLQQQHLAVATFVLPAGSSELDVYLDGKPYYMKCNLALSDTAREQVGTFLAVRHDLEEQGRRPGQYIDVRTAGRAYYK